MRFYGLLEVSNSVALAAVSLFPKPSTRNSEPYNFIPKSQNPKPQALNPIPNTPEALNLPIPTFCGKSESQAPSTAFESISFGKMTGINGGATKNLVKLYEYQLVV